MFRQSGNALFLILIAVALFAALSYAITQSGRGGGNITKETRQLQVAQLLQYVGSVSTAVTRITTIGGHVKLDVDFVGHGSDNARCTVDTCELFNTAAFGASFQDPDPAWLIADNADARWGEWRAPSTPVSGVGSTSPDMTLIINFVREDFCQEINRQVGLGTTIPQATNGINTFGTFSGETSGTNTLIDAGGILSGQQTGCYLDSGGSNYIFYHVLAVDTRD